MKKDISMLTHENFSKELRQKLNALIAKAGISHANIAKLSGIDYTTLSRLLNENPGRNCRLSLIDAARLYKHLGLEKPEDLFLSPKEFIEKYKLHEIKVKQVITKTVSLAEKYGLN